MCSAQISYHSKPKHTSNMVANHHRNYTAQFILSSKIQTYQQQLMYAVVIWMWPTVRNQILAQLITKLKLPGVTAFINYSWYNHTLFWETWLSPQQARKGWIILTVRSHPGLQHDLNSDSLLSYHWAKISSLAQPPLPQPGRFLSTLNHFTLCQREGSHQESSRTF